MTIIKYDIEKWQEIVHADMHNVHIKLNSQYLLIW